MNSQFVLKEKTLDDDCEIIEEDEFEGFEILNDVKLNNGDATPDVVVYLPPSRNVSIDTENSIISEGENDFHNGTNKTTFASTISDCFDLIGENLDEPHIFEGFDDPFDENMALLLASDQGELNVIPIDIKSENDSFIEDNSFEGFDDVELNANNNDYKLKYLKKFKHKRCGNEIKTPKNKKYKDIPTEDQSNLKVDEMILNRLEDFSSNKDVKSEHIDKTPKPIVSNDFIGPHCNAIGCTVSWLESAKVMKKNVKLSNGILYELDEFAKKIAWERCYVIIWALRIKGNCTIEPSENDLKILNSMIKRRRSICIIANCGKSSAKVKLKEFELEEFVIPSLLISKRRANAVPLLDGSHINSGKVEITSRLASSSVKVQQKVNSEDNSKSKVENLNAITENISSKGRIRKLTQKMAKNQGNHSQQKATDTRNEDLHSASPTPQEVNNVSLSIQSTSTRGRIRKSIQNMVENQTKDGKEKSSSLANKDSQLVSSMVLDDNHKNELNVSTENGSSKARIRKPTQKMIENQAIDCKEKCSSMANEDSQSVTSMVLDDNHKNDLNVNTENRSGKGKVRKSAKKLSENQIKEHVENNSDLTNEIAQSAQEDMQKNYLNDSHVAIKSVSKGRKRKLAHKVIENQLKSSKENFFDSKNDDSQLISSTSQVVDVEDNSESDINTEHKSRIRKPTKKMGECQVKPDKENYSGMKNKDPQLTSSKTREDNQENVFNDSNVGIESVRSKGRKRKPTHKIIENQENSPDIEYDDSQSTSPTPQVVDLEDNSESDVNTEDKSKIKKPTQKKGEKETQSCKEKTSCMTNEDAQLAISTAQKDDQENDLNDSYFGIESVSSKGRRRKPTHKIIENQEYFPDFKYDNSQLMSPTPKVADLENSSESDVNTEDKGNIKKPTQKRRGEETQSCKEKSSCMTNEDVQLVNSTAQEDNQENDLNGSNVGIESLSSKGRKRKPTHKIIENQEKFPDVKNDGSQSISPTPQVVDLEDNSESGVNTDDKTKIKKLTQKREEKQVKQGKEKYSCMTNKDSKSASSKVLDNNHENDFIDSNVNSENVISKGRIRKPTKKMTVNQVKDDKEKNQGIRKEDSPLVSPTGNVRKLRSKVAEHSKFQDLSQISDNSTTSKNLNISKTDSTTEKYESKKQKIESKNVDKEKHENTKSVMLKPENIEKKDVVVNSKKENFEGVKSIKDVEEKDKESTSIIARMVENIVNTVANDIENEEVLDCDKTLAVDNDITVLEDKTCLKNIPDDKSLSQKLFCDEASISNFNDHDHDNISACTSFSKSLTSNEDDDESNKELFNVKLTGNCIGKHCNKANLNVQLINSCQPYSGKLLNCMIKELILFFEKHNQGELVLLETILLLKSCDAQNNKSDWSLEVLKNHFSDIINGSDNVELDEYTLPECIQSNDVNGGNVQSDSKKNDKIVLTKFFGKSGSITKGDLVYLYSNWRDNKEKGEEVFVSDLQNSVECLFRERKVPKIHIPAGTLMSSSVTLYNEYVKRAKASKDGVKQYLKEDWVVNIKHLLSISKAPRRTINPSNDDDNESIISGDDRDCDYFDDDGNDDNENDDSKSTNDELRRIDNKSRRINDDSTEVNEESELVCPTKIGTDKPRAKHVKRLLDEAKNRIIKEELPPKRPRKSTLSNEWLTDRDLTNSNRMTDKCTKTKYSSEVQEIDLDYEVDKILACRHVQIGSKVIKEYKVRWVGFGTHKDSWVNEINLDCSERLAEFWSQASKRSDKMDSKTKSLIDETKNNNNIATVPVPVPRSKQKELSSFFQFKDNETGHSTEFFDYFLSTISDTKLNLGVNPKPCSNDTISKEEVLSIYDKWRQERRDQSLSPNNNNKRLEVEDLYAMVELLFKKKNINLDTKSLVSACYRMCFQRAKIKNPEILDFYLKSDFIEFYKACLLDNYKKRNNLAKATKPIVKSTPLQQKETSQDDANKTVNCQRKELTNNIELLNHTSELLEFAGNCENVESSYHVKYKQKELEKEYQHEKSENDRKKRNKVPYLDTFVNLKSLDLGLNSNEIDDVVHLIAQGFEDDVE